MSGLPSRSGQSCHSHTSSNRAVHVGSVVKNTLVNRSNKRPFVRVSGAICAYSASRSWIDVLVSAPHHSKHTQNHRVGTSTSDRIRPTEPPWFTGARLRPVATTAPRPPRTVP